MRGRWWDRNLQFVSYHCIGSQLKFFPLEPSGQWFYTTITGNWWSSFFTN